MSNLVLSIIPLVKVLLDVLEHTRTKTQIPVKCVLSWNMTLTNTKLIDFIKVERFGSIVDSYLVNLVNCMKANEK